jgi:dolichyl-diphosphooligosaccharide--protein glycosyltransferase
LAVRRDALDLAVIVVAAFFIRVYGPWHVVFAADRVDFLETDAWYHVRLIENQVRNWPWRVTLDPYAAPGGQFVPVAPFFDTITATATLMAHGPDATTAEIERLAAFVPPVLGGATIVFAWALGRRTFDRIAGLLAAALLAIIPGHFLDRTLLGFYDHHALEACLAIATLYAIAVALERVAENTGRYRESIAAGAVLGLYLLGWSGGALLVAILGMWMMLWVALARDPNDLASIARVTFIVALVALGVVLVFQDARMYRYGSQIVALTGLGGIALATQLVGNRLTFRPRRTAAVFAAIAIVAGVAALVIWLLTPSLMTQLLIDIRRLEPDPRRMAVLEARPLFLYPGSFYWKQPWEFFRSGFFIGAIALVLFTAKVWRDRRAIDLLIWCFTAAMFVATIGQNRFGYYLVPACALLGGWLATRILDWGGLSQIANPRSSATFPFQREIAIIVVAGTMFAPNLAPGVLTAARNGSFPQYWRDTMVWIRTHTPLPFEDAAHAGEDYYYARYPRDAVPPPDYSVMTWWDHGYWITQVARRVPVANPTQERAQNAARFYAATDEEQAVNALLGERSRYIVIDWELPFRMAEDSSMMGRFQSVLDWAGARHADYYEVLYRRERDAWRPVWVFHEPYYRSMTYRLMVLGGHATVPSNSTSLIVVADRVDTSGMTFGEIVSETTYPSYEAAAEALKARPARGRALLVGLDPWRPAFPVEGLTSLREVHATRTPEQKPAEAPWVRVFEVR